MACASVVSLPLADLRSRIIATHSIGDVPSTPPFVCNFANFKRVYASQCRGFKFDVLADGAKTIDDTHLSSQVAFLRDAFPMMANVADLLLYFDDATDIDSRALTADSIKIVHAVQQYVYKLSTSTVTDDVFAASTDEQSIYHVSTLDGLIIGDAFHSELLRQSRRHLKECIETWIGDVTKVRDLLHSFIPCEYPTDSSLFDKPDVMNKLVSNEHYSKLGQTNRLLKEMLDNLKLLNIKNRDPVVPLEFIESFNTCVNVINELVVLTFCLYLKLEVLPPISDKKMREAEVQKTKSILSEMNQAMPDYVEKHVLAMCV
eukprot:TRINITY_DN11309_c0_g3_i1.p1 TRINITY_DN11309_c0_g3~~TRINITY_DN11309_c0_g3_i1.p1  ORF type:complete len:317 (-),score=35.73 TRINITY_DN11309_c0_g3_i1:126-1076(-)